MIVSAKFLRLLCSGILLSALLFTFTACKKDKQQISNTVTGTWRNLTNPYSPDSYYVLTSDNKLYNLFYDIDHYKSVFVTTFRVTGSQIFIQGTPGYTQNELYNMVFSGDTLFLNNTPASDIVLVKESNWPKSTSDWVKPVTVLDRFTDTASIKTLTYYSGKLYAFKHYSTDDKLLEYNLATHTISTVTSADNYYSGLEYINGELWCVRSTSVYKFNPATGSQIFQSAASSFSLVSVAGENANLYCTGTNGNYCRYRTGDDSWYYDYETFQYAPTDLAVANGYLYMAKGGLIHQTGISNHAPLSTFYLENYDVRGIAFDGTYFWVSAYNEQTNTYEILKLSLEE